MIDEAKRDGGGKISYEEIIKIMKFFFILYKNKILIK